MPAFTYDPGLVFDDTTLTPVTSSPAGVLLDRAGGAPQPVYDLLGNLLPGLASNAQGYVARFKADVASGVMSFGSVTQPVISVEAQNSGPQATAAQVAAQASATSAQTAATSATAAQTSAAASAAAALAPADTAVDAGIGRAVTAGTVLSPAAATGRAVAFATFFGG